MAVENLLLDSGPLVALLRPRDRDHKVCRDFFEQFRGTQITTDAVVTEATFLLSRFPGGSAQCLEFFIRGGAVPVGFSRERLVQARFYLERYGDRHMEFADATLMALAEETGIDRIFTLDRRAFRVYRTKKKRPLPIVP